MLELDRELPGEPPAMGRVKIQAAVTLLVAGESARVHRVIAALAEEDPSAIDNLITQLYQERRKDFWEFTMLGINYAYLDPEERDQLDTVRRRLSALRGPS
jgi:hypothetical protein